MSSDRLKDLQRQRALAQEQAAALEREIAKEMGGAPAPAAPAASTPAPLAPEAAIEADKLIEQYAQEEKPVHDQVKRGCLIYLASALGIVGLGILALYIYHLLK